MDYFFARGLSPSGQQKLDPGECLTVKRVPLKGLIDVLVHGKDADGIPDVVDGKLHVAVFFLAAHLSNSHEAER